MQEKLKRFRQFRPMVLPGQNFEPKKWWKFAITSVIKSIRFKKGAIHAFKIPKEELSTYETKFKPKFKQLYLCSTDLEKENLINVTWQENQRKEFWNITSMASQETLT